MRGVSFTTRNGAAADRSPSPPIDGYSHSPKRKHVLANKNPAAPSLVDFTPKAPAGHVQSARYGSPNSTRLRAASPTLSLYGTPSALTARDKPKADKASSTIFEGRASSSIFDGRTSPAILNGRASSSIFDGRTSPAILDGRASSSIFDGRTSPAILDGRASSSIFDGRTSPAVLDGRASSSIFDGKGSTFTFNGRTSPAIPASRDGPSSPRSSRQVRSVPVSSREMGVGKADKASPPRSKSPQIHSFPQSHKRAVTRSRTESAVPANAPQNPKMRPAPIATAQQKTSPSSSPSQNSNPSSPAGARRLKELAQGTRSSSHVKAEHQPGPQSHQPPESQYEAVKKQLREQSKVSREPNEASRVVRMWPQSEYENMKALPQNGTVGDESSPTRVKSIVHNASITTMRHSSPRFNVLSPTPANDIPSSSTGRITTRASYSPLTSRPSATRAPSGRFASPNSGEQADARHSPAHRSSSLQLRASSCDSSPRNTPLYRVTAKSARLASTPNPAQAKPLGKAVSMSNPGPQSGNRAVEQHGTPDILRNGDSAAGGEAGTAFHPEHAVVHGSLLEAEAIRNESFTDLAKRVDSVGSMVSDAPRNGSLVRLLSQAQSAESIASLLRGSSAASLESLLSSIRSSASQKQRPGSAGSMTSQMSTGSFVKPNSVLSMIDHFELMLSPSHAQAPPEGTQAQALRDLLEEIKREATALDRETTVTRPWVCCECFVDNDGGTECSCCGAARITADTKTNSWMCEFCGLANPNDVAKCRGCWKWRPKCVHAFVCVCKTCVEHGHVCVFHSLCVLSQWLVVCRCLSRGKFYSIPFRIHVVTPTDL